MNLFLRLLWVLLRAASTRKLTLNESSVCSVRVWPNDLDFNFHLTNARFLSLMDLGRVDLIVRLGFAKTLRRKRWFPVIGGTSITYFKSLKLFQTAELSTHIVGWDEDWLYIAQSLHRNKTDIAVSTCKVAFRSRKARIPIDELAEALCIQVKSPPLPREIQDSLQPTKEN